MTSATQAAVDHYNILGVHRHASKDDIRAAYKGKALALHPDKNPNGEALFKLVVNAYQTLMSPTKKCAYDRDLDLRETRRPAYGAPQRSTSPPRQAPAAASSRGAAAENAYNRYTSNEQLFKDAYSQYKTGTNSGYNADAKTAGKKFYEEAQGNFSDWFKKKQDELRAHEEQTRAKAEYAKKLEDEEREKAEAWRRMQRDRERDRESEMEREKERRRREMEQLRKEQETQLREEKNQALHAKMREFSEAQKRQQHDMERHLNDLQAQKDELRAQKERLAREREAAAAAVNPIDEQQKLERQRRREEEIADEIRHAEAKIRNAREQILHYEAEQRSTAERRRREEEAAVLEARERELRLEREEAAREAAEAARSEERRQQASNIGAQRRKVMDSMMHERKQHEEEVQAMRKETDRIEAEMRAKLEALRAAKREGKTINVDDYKL